MLHASNLITLLTLVCLLSFGYVWHNVIGHVLLQISSYQPLNISSYFCCQYGLNFASILVFRYLRHLLITNFIFMFRYILLIPRFILLSPRMVFVTFETLPTF